MNHNPYIARSIRAIARDADWLVNICNAVLLGVPGAVERQRQIEMDEGRPMLLLLYKLAEEASFAQLYGIERRVIAAYDRLYHNHRGR